jgi:hypothetical protein
VRNRPIAALTLLLTLAASTHPARADWPMLGHDAARSGATTTEVRPPFERKWYRAFPEEGLMAGVQPVVARGRLFIGTLRGVLHCIDPETGQDLWTYQAGGPILHACEAGHRRVFFTCADGKVYCLSAADGKPQWTFQTGSALWNAPAHDGTDLLVGGRDGKLYALHPTAGKVRWQAGVGGPILNSPAIDEQRSRVYVGAEDMHVYAFDRDTGRQLWQSEKLPGVSFRGYHPVIAPDGSVMVTSQPCAGGDAIQQVVLDMAKEVFGDFASWRHSKEENAKLREQNFKLMEDPQTYAKQLAYLRKRLTDEPAYQTFFLLDGQRGRQKFVAPIVYAESMNGPGAPPLVTPDGKVIIKYSALLRSRYEHYSPFLNVGYLDTATGHITPVMDQSRTYGWHDSLLLVHDEQSQLSVGGKVLINAHQDNVNALDLDTLRGYPAPFCHNVHEPPPDAAVAVWASHLAGTQLPAGWEWFARGTAVYGGGSAIDAPVVVAGDSFYYLPTHEISAGCVLLASRMKPDGKAADKAPPPKDKLSGEQWKSIQWSGRWDWDTLASPRLDLTLKSLPEPAPGTRQRPLTDAARSVVDTIRDVDLDYQTRLQFPENRAAPKPPEKLSRELDRAVEELISRSWRPLILPAGKAPAESYRFFTDPSETLYTLALAFPHLSDGRQRKVIEYVRTLRTDRSYDPADGAVRSAYDPAPDKLLKLADGVAPRSDTARLYPLWLWAFEANDWEQLKADWPELRQKIKLEPDPGENDCGNARIAGLIAACRIAKAMKDKETEDKLVPALRPILRQRLVYELSHTRGGLITMTPDNRRAVFGRWRNLTPDVARLCHLHARDVHAGLMDLYVDHHRPTWWLAWNVETLWANEVPTAFPTESQEVFAARAMILAEPATRLQSFLDRPWCRADEYYIQKLALTIGNANGAKW